MAAAHAIQVMDTQIHHSQLQVLLVLLLIFAVLKMPKYYWYQVLINVSAIVPLQMPPSITSSRLVESKCVFSALNAQSLSLNQEQREATTPKLVNVIRDMLDLLLIILEL